jgi:hypothetical protein
MSATWMDFRLLLSVDICSPRAAKRSTLRTRGAPEWPNQSRLRAARPPICAGHRTADRKAAERHHHSRLVTENSSVIPPALTINTCGCLPIDHNWSNAQTSGRWGCCAMRGIASLWEIALAATVPIGLMVAIAAVLNHLG